MTTRCLKGQRSKRPAVLDPDSLEAAVYGHGLSGWNEVRQE